MEFDYVIVGGGSAGCVLAARLSEDPSISVCLLEAGGAGRSWLIRTPIGAVAMVPGFGKINNWAFRTVPQPGLNGRRGHQPRGRALGGSSAINAMLYTRGQREDYDGWAALGCDGWGWDDVLPYFRKAERNQHGADSFHGDSGPLHVSDQKAPRPVSLAFVAANAETQIPETADFNTGDNTGAALFQCTQFYEGPKTGQRCSAAAGYLHPVMDQRSNLSVVTQARASRILLEDGRATGVAYRQGKTDKTVRARCEVILAAGAFQSPQILQLSGIGHPDDLRPHGIEVKHALPGVGRNLQDHLDFTLSYRSHSRDMFGVGPRATLRLLNELRQWRRTGRSMAASTFAEAGSFFKTDPALDRPDVQTHFVTALVENHARKLFWGYGYSCHVCVLRPYARGTVTLQSANALDPPQIDPRFLSDERDLATLVAGVRRTLSVMEAPALGPYRKNELHGITSKTSDADLIAHIRARADTIYHPVGTCQMGTGPDAVVDTSLRVHGVSGLRVVDASIMPTLISGNTNAPTIMIAEKAADMIKADRAA